MPPDVENVLDLHTVTHEDFEPCLNDRFVIEREKEPPVELELVSVEARTSSKAAGGRRQPFSLLFHGPRAPALGQGTFAMANDRLGGMALFLVPVRGDESGMLYEALFT